MQVRLNNSGEVLVRDLRVARNVWARTRGLMLARRLPEGSGLDIRPCSSIHMMFMRQRIDAVFYDRAFRVTRVVSDLPTWYGLAFAPRGTWGVIELPPLAASQVNVGDVLEFAEERG